ncbi:hypothetical protein [Myxococcus sp. RHSTA-1-4]|uniref:hypothetical protein n=1 Tax=Myxococcus sp. RHSTA-1-4 TaxID=2874601 RepID=UPI001CBA7915|nr:hypothetical protein [Myxococcus sp. RHSTA-1-4]MBZ4419964.1 hypothetical protein [Myxococcus sp. RHSTA-1-4]
MKNLPGVLAFSTVLLLAVGCHKNTGEGPGPTDAASQANPRDAMEAVKDAGGPSEGAQTGTQRGAMTSSTDDAGTVTMESSKPLTDAGTSGMAKSSGSGGSREAVEACVDRWLKSNGLDKYGHPEGTMYAGGTPLFDERTGERQDRLEYVFQRKPEARKACEK